MQAIIVEDSRLARVELKALLKEHPQIEIVGEAANVEQAVEILQSTPCDLLFLDINLPDGDGFEVLNTITAVPEVIFTTAYDQYALQAFEVNALDYLMKPVNPAKLARALERLDPADNSTTSQEALAINSKIFVKDGDRCWLIEVGKIRHFESCGNHSQIAFEQEKAFVYKSLSKIEERLPADVFFRANRQFIVNLNSIAKVEPWGNNCLLLTMTDGKEVETSRRHSSNFKQLLSL
jgi:two-component system, LytTR family, response regulator